MNNNNTTTTTTTTTATSTSTTTKNVEVGKSGKRICCSCPDTKRARDECVVQNGEDKCKNLIEAHNACLRSEGFKV